MYEEVLSISFSLIIHLSVIHFTNHCCNDKVTVSAVDNNYAPSFIGSELLTSAPKNSAYIKTNINLIPNNDNMTITVELYALSTPGENKAAKEMAT